MTFEDIEDKIIQEITTNLTYIKTVETYAGQLEQEIKTLPIKFPAVFVVYAGSTYQWVDGPNHQEICKFTILVVAQNLRGQKSARKDTYGCYQMINDVLNTLTNKTFSLDIEKLKPVRVDLIYVSASIAIYGIDFETSFDTTFTW